MTGTASSRHHRPGGPVQGDLRSVARGGGAGIRPTVACQGTGVARHLSAQVLQASTGQAVRPHTTSCHLPSCLSPCRANRFLWPAFIFASVRYCYGCLRLLINKQQTERDVIYGLHPSQSTNRRCCMRSSYSTQESIMNTTVYVWQLAVQYATERSGQFPAQLLLSGSCPNRRAALQVHIKVKTPGGID